MVCAGPRRTPMGSRRRAALLAARSPLPVHGPRLVPTHVSDAGGSSGTGTRGSSSVRCSPARASGSMGRWWARTRVATRHSGSMSRVRSPPASRTCRARGRQQLEHQDDARRASGNRTDGARLSLVGLRRHRPSGCAGRVAGRLHPEAAHHGRSRSHARHRRDRGNDVGAQHDDSAGDLAPAADLVRLDGDREVSLTVPAARWRRTGTTSRRRHEAHDRAHDLAARSRAAVGTRHPDILQVRDRADHRVGVVDLHARRSGFAGSRCAAQSCS